MAPKRMKATTIALGREMDLLLTRAARAQGISRSEFVRQQLELALEQFRKHPAPRVAGIIRGRLRDDARTRYVPGRST